MQHGTGWHDTTLHLRASGCTPRRKYFGLRKGRGLVSAQLSEAWAQDVPEFRPVSAPSPRPFAMGEWAFCESTAFSMHPSSPVFSCMDTDVASPFLLPTEYTTTRSHLHFFTPGTSQKAQRVPQQPAGLQKDTAPDANQPVCAIFGLFFWGLPRSNVPLSRNTVLGNTKSMTYTHSQETSFTKRCRYSQRTRVLDAAFVCVEMRFVRLGPCSSQGATPRPLHHGETYMHFGRTTLVIKQQLTRNAPWRVVSRKEHPLV